MTLDELAWAVVAARIALLLEAKVRGDYNLVTLPLSDLGAIGDAVKSSYPEDVQYFSYRVPGGTVLVIWGVSDFSPTQRLIDQLSPPTLQSTGDA